jgi:tetratricopeptide (TPR) repeat protein
MMKSLITICIGLGLLLLNACSGVKKEGPKALLQAEIERLEKLLQADVEMVHADSALQLMRDYQEFYTHNPNDSLSPRYIFDAAKIAEGIGKYDKAVELLTIYHDAFKAAPGKDFAVYRIAFIYDEHMKDKPKAEAWYNKVIELYPQSKWAEESKNALAILYMSDEELINYLNQKNS